LTHAFRTFPQLNPLVELFQLPLFFFYILLELSPLLSPSLFFSLPFFAVFFLTPQRDGGSGIFRGTV